MSGPVMVGGLEGPEVAAILFGVAALGGATMATVRLNHKQPPMALALAHGALAATALVTLFVSWLRDAAPGSVALPASLVVFVLTALGGSFLFSYHLRGKLIPVRYMLAHGTLALSGYGCLLANVIAGK